MRIVISIMLAALVLTLPLSVIAAPSQQATFDLKSLALAKGDLQWRGFEIVPDRTVSEDRPDGVAVYDITYARERSPENLASGPFEIRSGVARTAAVDDAVLQLDSTKQAFLSEGWEETNVPPLGDDTLGLTQTTDGDGGKIAHFSYLFRKGSYILMISVRGRPDVTKLTDAVGLAIVVSGRLDKALASGGTPAASGSTTASGPSTGSTGSAGAQPTGEKARVVNADGGSVNMRSQPSMGADVVTQVSEGTTLDVVGPNRDGDGRTWRNVQTSDKKSGWIASSFLESIAAPPAAPSPSPLPRAAATDTPAPAADAGQQGADASTDDSPETTPTATPSATATAQASGASSPSGNTFKGSGNGLDVEGTIRDLNLSSGKQQVKVKVTRGGGGVADAFVTVTTRLSATRFRSIKLDNTNQDGYTEIEFDMDGPPGTYEVIVEAKTDVNGPVTTAKSSFRWKS
jgi:hypothetical protein